MGWKKQARDNAKYLKFAKGEFFEGVYQGYETRANPFYDASNPNSTTDITDYKIEIGGEEKILSSTAKTLKDQLIPLETPCEVRIECVVQGIKKFYVVYTKEEVPEAPEGADVQ